MKARLCNLFALALPGLCLQPVIVIGTAVSIVSMISYGMAETYTAAVIARIIGGLLNGVLGAWKCIIGESGDSLVQVSTVIVSLVCLPHCCILNQVHMSQACHTCIAINRPFVIHLEHYRAQ
jgi:hypothetical protein